MKSRVAGAVFATVGLLAAGCATVPYTKRSQFMLVSESQETQLGAAAFQEVLKKEPVSRDPAANAAVREVGERIARAADRPDYKWEFVVIDDPKTVNAFALPGGKVAVYTGLFPVARDEAGLAVVMGHEVAHALARHGAERISQQQAVQLGAIGASVALGSAAPATQSAIMQAFGLGAQVGVLLPFSRKQESEADQIGMILMAKAGYDPEAAVGLWERMRTASGGKGPPELLSTHPSDDTRIERIREFLPQARRYYVADPTLVVSNLPAAH